MSFDLSFCRADETVPAIAELKEYFQTNSLFEANDTAGGGVQFWYQNPATGVYCDFSYSPLDAEEQEGCGKSGLSFNLNYARPSFFAFETMPLVQAYCRHFKLQVEDPQADTVGPADAQSLIESWQSHNASAVKAMQAMRKQEEVALHYLAEDRATDWWRYMSRRQRLEESLTEDLFVPTMITLLNPAREVFTMIVCPIAIAQFFPRCQYLCVKRETRRLFRTKEEIGLVAYETVIDAISTLLEEYEFEGLRINCLRPAKLAAATERLQKVPLLAVDLSQYTQLASGDYHDVALSLDDSPMQLNVSE